MNFGLIGENVKESLGTQIYKYFGLEDYELASLSKIEMEEFLNSKKFKGVNITIPYKMEAYNQCECVSLESKETGVTNTVVNKEGVLHGYNTDVYGVEYLLDQSNIDISNKNCLILGTGATSKTIEFVLRKRGAKNIAFLSRNKVGENIYSYENIKELQGFSIIFNTTPVGMYGRNFKDPVLDFSSFTNCEYFIDVIYKPFNTINCLAAKKCGIKTVSGMNMFVGQAAKSFELYTGKHIEKNVIRDGYINMIKNNFNIVLIGHPYSGKTTIGNALSKRLDMKFIDIDSKIEKDNNASIDKIFKQKGEAYFRQLEKNELSEDYSGKILSLGGGCILHQKEMENIVKNSIVVNLCRDPEFFNNDNSRPLISCKNDLCTLIEKRKREYIKFSNFTVFNNESIEECVDKIMELL